MRLSDKGYDFIKNLEPYSNKPYRNQSGVLVVGINHTGDDIDESKTYSDEELKDMFYKDNKSIEDDVNLIYDERFMFSNMFDACFSFALNVGNISNTDLGRMIQKNPYDDNLRDFWKYTYTSGGKNKTLVERRKSEIKMYFNCDDYIKHNITN